MTPTEKKAREIYERFIPLAMDSASDILRGGEYNAKQCALICVDREIEIYKSYMHYEMVKDLQEIKQHIEKL